jgi:hypothetical protein
VPLATRTWWLYDDDLTIAAMYWCETRVPEGSLRVDGLIKLDQRDGTVDREVVSASPDTSRFQYSMSADLGSQGPVSHPALGPSRSTSRDGEI